MFFNSKKHWSRRKDAILGCYLEPYLPKIATQKAPILIVDAFAGPGKFLDGESGSPLIICEKIEQALSRNLKVPVSALFIEADKECHSKLEQSISKFPFAKAVRGEFSDFLHEIEEKAKNHSIFLYLDPFTVEGLEWIRMDHVFQHLSVSKASIELLLNFNAQSFVRRGLAALKLAVPESDLEAEDLEEIDPILEAIPSIERLNKVVGGNWWQGILRSSNSFPQKVQGLTNGVCNHLSRNFNEVCQHAVKAYPHHIVPKYYLIFGSRHPDALLLMNDEMAKSRQTLADMAKPKQPTLFETRPMELVPDIDILPSIILKHAAKPSTRKRVILQVIRDCFCEYTLKQIRRCIKQMLKDGKLISETGKVEINDKVKIWAESNN